MLSIKHWSHFGGSPQRSNPMKYVENETCLCGLGGILYCRLIFADSCCHKGDNDAPLSKVMVVATWTPSSFSVTIHEALMGWHLHTYVYLSELSCPVKRLLIRWDLCPYSAGMAHWLWRNGQYHIETAITSQSAERFREISLTITKPK